MDVKQSTYSATQEKIATFVPAEPTPEPSTPSATPEVPVTPPAPTEPSSEPLETPPAEDISSADFALQYEEEPAPTSQPQQPATSPVINWKEELKKNRDEALLELGFSPFALEMDKHIKAGGKPIDYLMAKAIDYNSVSDEKLIKDKLSAQYPNLKPEQIDLMFENEYLPEEDDIERVKEMKLIKLQADGYSERQKKIAEQRQFKVADAIPLPEDAGYKQYKEQLAQSQQQYEQNVQFYNNHAATKTLNESKRVTVNFGEGIPPFNFKIEKPELITKALTDDGTIMHKLMTTQSGEPDVEKEQLVTLFAFSPQKFIQTVFNYGMQQGVQKKLVEENQNAKRPGATVLPMSPDQKPVFRQGTYGDIANK